MTTEEFEKDGAEGVSDGSSDRSEPAKDEVMTGVDATVSAEPEGASGTEERTQSPKTARDLARENEELLARIRALEVEQSTKAERRGSKADLPSREVAEDDASASEDGESLSFRRRFSVAAPLRFGLHAACYYAGKTADKVVGLYSRAFKMDREYVADFNKTTGIACARREQWESAIPLLEKALATEPDDLEALLHLAEACNAIGQYDQACEHLERALAANPDSTKVVRALGMIYVRQQDYGRAIEYLEKAIALEPDHALTRYRLGAAYDNSEEYDKAVISFKEAIRLDPRLAKAYQALGFTYESMGNRDQAVRCFKKALELD